MGFYDLSKSQRAALVEKIKEDIAGDLQVNEKTNILEYFSDEDTYIRKAAYLGIGRLYLQSDLLKPKILSGLKGLLNSRLPKVRQTTINSAGEIGKTDFEVVREFFDIGLFDSHHSVRNAVIGSLKKMGQKNPEPTLKWAAFYLKHKDKEIRREICHGIELRGRTHPQDILPMLEELQFEPTARVRNTLIHVLGQIAYKKGCLETVITALNGWKNEEVVDKALDEIVNVHRRYKNFSFLSEDQAIRYIERNYRVQKNPDQDRRGK